MSAPDPISEEEILARLNYSSAPNTPSKNPFARLQNAEDKANFWIIIGLLGGAAVAWIIISAVLAVFPWWMIVLTAAGLGGYVYFRSWRVEHRRMLVEAGFCGQCGYDLRGSPTICPECGRDARLDEPTWRKLKREHAERARKLGQMPVKPAGPVSHAPVLPIQQPVPVRKLVHRPPPVLDPIPVEGDE